MNSTDEALAGARDVIAEWISEDQALPGCGPFVLRKASSAQRWFPDGKERAPSIKITLIGKSQLKRRRLTEYWPVAEAMAKDLERSVQDLLEDEPCRGE